MRGAIDWSWNLLQPWEQAALAQCAVFSGGFSLDAGEAVLDLSAWPGAPCALDVIQALCDKSLLRTWRPDEAQGEVRYGMYESIHEYALERLAALSPEAARAAYARHLEVYVRFAVDAGGADGGRTYDVGVLDQLSLEHDNLHAALKRAFAGADAPAGAALQVAVSLWRYWLVRGHYAEGRAFLEAGLERRPERDALRARACGALAGLAAMLGDAVSAHARGEEALSIWRALGDEAGEACALTSLGFQAYRLGDLELAMTYCLEGLAVARAATGPAPLAFCLNIAGMTATKLGRLEEAHAWLEEAARVCRQTGNRQYLANVLESLGTAVYATSGEHAVALPCYLECLELYRDLGDLGGAPLAIERFAQAAAGQGDHERAALLFGAGRGMRDRLGMTLEPVMEAEYAPLQCSLRAALGDKRYADAFNRGRALRNEDAIALALAL
jgi:non-specific serine/threonine protein kinase